MRKPSGEVLNLYITSAGLRSGHTQTPCPSLTQIVDFGEQGTDVHPGFRAFHAKGVVVEGSFKASPEAARPAAAA